MNYPNGKPYLKISLWTDVRIRHFQVLNMVDEVLTLEKDIEHLILSILKVA